MISAMMIMSLENKPMRLYRAIYREGDLAERRLDLYAHSLARATMSAAELIGPQGTLVRVYENPDW